MHPGIIDVNGTDMTHDIRNKPRTFSRDGDPRGGGRWFGKGESLSSEAAVQIMVNERQRMEDEYAQLRIENQKLKSELNRNRSQSQPPQLGPSVSLHASRDQRSGGGYQQQQQQQQQQSFATPPAKSFQNGDVNNSQGMGEVLPPVIVPEKVGFATTNADAITIAAAIANNANSAY